MARYKGTQGSRKLSTHYEELICSMYILQYDKLIIEFSFKQTGVMIYLPYNGLLNIFVWRFIPAYWATLAPENIWDIQVFIISPHDEYCKLWHFLLLWPVVLPSEWLAGTSERLIGTFLTLGQYKSGKIAIYIFRKIIFSQNIAVVGNLRKISS